MAEQRAELRESAVAELPRGLRTGRRRRGEQLELAIFDAVVKELADVGYDALTMEAIAARAHTGKAALYRRWSSKEDLVLDALHWMLPCLDDPPDTGSVRDDLVDLLGRMAATISSPTGCAVQNIMGNLKCGPEMVQTVHAQVIQPRKQLLVDALRRGAERGEVRAEAVSQLVAEVGPAMIVQRFMTEGPPITIEHVEAIVDEIVLPMIRPAAV